MPEPAAETAAPAGRGSRPSGRALGPLGRRLVVAFSLVSLVAVGLLTLAAQQAVERGISIAAAGGRWGAGQELAALAADAYAATGSWAGADLEPVLDGAARLGVHVTVLDAAGDMVVRSDGAAEAEPGGTGQGGTGQGGDGSGAGGRGRGGTGGGAMGWTSAVLVDGAQVGAVVVAIDPGADARAETQGRDLAWSWIVGAAVASLAFAVLAGWVVTRRLTGPLTSLAAITRTFASGDRAVRADEAAPGELGDVARGVNEAFDSAERSARARRQMAADVAHEVRTPLAALQAGLEEVRDGLVAADRETLGRLHDQAVRLGRVVGDLQVLATIDEAPLGMVSGRVDLARIVAEELQARRAELRAAGIEVRGVRLAPVEVRADADRMHQVVGNLLANVARHCRAGDAVEVEVAPSGHEALLRVVDTGPGIPAEHVPRAFDRYWRGAHQGVVGSGLGLAVVREIVTAHGGSVDLGSPPGGGTAVVVRLPALGTPSGAGSPGAAG